MNRAGFFQAIGGGIAAMVGIKNVPECLSYTANAPPCRPMMLADVIKAKKIIEKQKDWTPDDWMTPIREEYINILRKGLPKR